RGRRVRRRAAQRRVAESRPPAAGHGRVAGRLPLGGQAGPHGRAARALALHLRDRRPSFERSCRCLGERRARAPGRLRGGARRPPVPSSLPFEAEDPRLSGLAGVAVNEGGVRREGSREVHAGPLLVTHWGLSGPAVLKASAWGARLLHDNQYRLGLIVDWLPGL